MKRAVALSGGGSRGSYELGVWTSLRENGVDYQMVTGTSIGALNGALMAQEDYELACELWRTLTIDKIMEDGINLESSIEGMLNQKADLMPFLKKYMEYRGADITPLKQLLNRIIDEKRLRTSPIGFGLVTVGFPNLIPYELTKTDIPQGQLTDFLLASASCFPAFPMCKIEGKSYIDGGYYDNLPINLALKMGAEEVVAVDLDYPPAHWEYLDHPLVTYIKPSWDLGSFLLFDPTVMAGNTTLGYNDAQKAYGRCLGFRYTFQNDDEAVYQETSKQLVQVIARLEAGLSDPGKRTILKQSKNPLTDCIAEHMDGRHPTCLHYFIRSLECCAELLEIDHLQQYSLSGFIDLLRQKMEQIPYRDCERHFRHLKSIRLPAELIAAIDKMNRKELLACVYRRLLSPDITPSDMEFFATSLSRELSALLGLVCTQRERPLL